MGKIPSKYICRVGSCRRMLRDSRPMFSDKSWNRILMKIRLLEVVSSSVRRMLASTDQLMASVVNKCCITATQPMKTIQKQVHACLAKQTSVRLHCLNMAAVSGATPQTTPASCKHALAQSLENSPRNTERTSIDSHAKHPTTLHMNV